MVARHTVPVSLGHTQGPAQAEQAASSILTEGLRSAFSSHEHMLTASLRNTCKNSEKRAPSLQPEALRVLLLSSRLTERMCDPKRCRAAERGGGTLWHWQLARAILWHSSEDPAASHHCYSSTQSLGTFQCPRQVQALMARRCIIVTRVPSPRSTFDVQVRPTAAVLHRLHAGLASPSPRHYEAASHNRQTAGAPTHPQEHADISSTRLP